MQWLAALRWTFFVILALCVGIALGLPGGAESSQRQALEAEANSTIHPLVLEDERDYHAVEGVVAEFNRWQTGAPGPMFESRYPPDRITAQRQREFFNYVVGAAVRAGEMQPVIEGCALRAINTSNDFERHVAQDRGDRHPSPRTLLVYAERANYFGQDVWCFLCLGTADGEHGTARAIVASCVPSFGLVHIQTIGNFGAS